VKWADKPACAICATVFFSREVRASAPLSGLRRVRVRRLLAAPSCPAGQRLFEPSSHVRCVQGRPRCTSPEATHGPGFIHVQSYS
jgi:hypothetical protein